MSEVLQANIFFFITSVAVVLVTILVCVVLFYVARVFRSMDRMVRRLDESSAAFADTLMELRERIAQGKVLAAIGLLLRRIAPRASRSSKKAVEDTLDT